MRKSKYNLMFVTASLQTGGLETYLLNVLKVLDRDMFSPIVVYNGLGKDDFVPILQGMAFPVHKVSNSRWQIDFIRKIRQIIKDYKIDIVCDFRDDFSAPTLAAAWMTGVQSRVAMYRSSRPCFKPSLLKNAYAWILHKLVSCLATKIIGNTSKVLDNYYENWKTNKKCAIVHNGVPLQDYLLQKNKSMIRRELGIPENAFVVGHVGRFHESKNHITLIRLFSKIKSQCPSAHLLLVGDGELRPEIEAALEDNVVKTDITMTGIRNDIARLHAAMDVFVYPSIYEGMPTAFVEAMISGLAFVASNIEEIAEIVPSELQTQLYDPCDENAMCNAVVELYRDTTRRDKIGEIGRLWAMDRYTIEKSAKLLCGHMLEPFTEQ